MNPQVFGKEHLIYIFVSIIVALAVFILTKRFVKTEKLKNIVIKVAGAILFIIIFMNRLVLVFEHNQVDWILFVPDTICSTSSFVLSLAILFGKKDNKVLHFIWLVSLAGGVITTFYPNFIGQNSKFMYPPTIFGMLHHTWGAIVVILLFLLGYLKLTYKKWYCTLIGFTSYLSYGAFLMCVLKIDNPLYMTGPALDGTIFTVWVLIPIYFVVYGLILGVLELIRNKDKLLKK